MNKWLKELWADARIEAGLPDFDDEGGVVMRGYWSSVSWFILRNIWVKVVCKVRGHDIEMEGHAGPDSGWEYWWCARGCGFGDRVVYY